MNREQGSVGNFSGLGVPSINTAVSQFVPIPLICGSDDDRANLMWKRYLEREDSKIVGMQWHTLGV